ncbi:DEAD/DEAH box helicase [Sutterella sp.]|uniref:DEAD/DEAH box helicase n=1 Tax=Sutterella sp. TaxID=1981025 RepID=UPI0026E0039F|nr:DEAD/DEAH box helicase [Sutterella sp.]MDO5532300.1 DEAD/DEAH box helicase [Sutterella sp.]
MLPSFVERDIEEGLTSFIEREFPISTPGFSRGGKSVVRDFLENRENFLQGPWVEIRRPFRAGDIRIENLLELLCERNPEVKEKFSPYAHQVAAFKRLKYPEARSTIIATGTGSGKTECFLLPIIDAVLQMRAEDIPGIKAILIYPMNALADDQAKRIARLLDDIKKQSNIQLTAGIYTGAKVKEKARKMTGSMIINDRETLRRYPPDILLTNYKMLDYLLLRREDRALWEGTSPRSLRYLVVDELHTFDGAQGTDLACLVRRLRDFIGLDKSLACIGTSATLGDGDALPRLIDYAEDVFGADFSDKDAVITEDRLSADEYLESFGDYRPAGHWPDVWAARTLFELKASAPAERWLMAAVNCWFSPADGVWKRSLTETALALAEKLPHLEAFRRLISEKRTLLDLRELAARWRRETHELENFTPSETMMLLRSLIALVSTARVMDKGRVRPFLTVRVQSWTRELRNLLATVSAKPRLVLAADHDAACDGIALPLVSCSACNATGWMGDIRQGFLEKNSSDLYTAWFRRAPSIGLFYPVRREEFRTLREKNSASLYHFCPSTGEFRYVRTKDESEAYAFCPICHSGNGSEDEPSFHEPIIVQKPEIVTKTTVDGDVKTIRSDACPNCGESGTLRIFGARATTLAAALTGHLNSSSTNDDHKLIAFSDSVQDAAYRAGFLDARSRRYVVRQAIAGFMRENERSEMSLTEFLTFFSDHWVDRTGKSDELRRDDNPNIREKASDIAAARFITTFIPADMLWRQAWLDFSEQAEANANNLDSRDPEGNEEIRYRFIPEVRTVTSEGRDVATAWGKLFANVQARLKWDAFVELTLQSHSGRTVELAGIGALAPAPDLIRIAAADFADRVSHRCPEHFAQMTQEKYERFVAGFLEHERQRGAFDLTGQKGLEDFVNFAKSAESFKYLNRSLELPAYTKRWRPPAPLTFRRPHADREGFFDTVLPGSARGRTWYVDWLQATLDNQIGTGEPAFVEEVYNHLFDALIASQGMKRFPISTESGHAAYSYLLNPSSWKVKRTLARAVCTECGCWHTVAPEDGPLWTAMPCLSRNCSNNAHRVEMLPPDPGLYVGEPMRAVAREHTATIDDNQRKSIEKSFTNGSEPWNVNLLSATTTLEMGIDIGDLSSVLLFNPPRTPSNYLQRIGRAGRRDGNALAMTLCGTNQHGQYFWADPVKMLSGAVEPPGVFLHAMAVLERQLLAFAVTRWMTEVPTAHIPKTVGALLANSVSLLDPIAPKNVPPDAFPEGFIDFTNTNSATLFKDFVDLFDPSGTFFTEAERHRLLVFIEGSASSGTPSMAMRLRDRIESIRRRRQEISDKIKLYEGARPKSKDGLDEEQQKDEEELKGLIASLKKVLEDQFDKKQTLELLTDEGLLPNYAFPEEGIRIESLVFTLRGRDKDLPSETGDEPAARDKKRSQGVYKRLTFHRSASTGLTEAVPENTFYASQYAMHIDQVQLDDKGAQSWRFCPKCQYARPETPETRSSACPRCGSPAWQERSQVRQVLSLRTVHAWADVRRDRIADLHEDRESFVPRRRLFVDIEPGSVQKGYILEHADGFGFEYIPTVTLRDINFGAASAEDTEFVDAAGEHISAPGFTICAGCGRVKKRAGKEKEGRRQHDYDCEYRKKSDDAVKWLKGLLLMRVYSTEALRIRLPASLCAGRWSSAQVNASALAALRLGLRRYYRGAVSHLKSTIVSSPLKGSDATDTCIVLYDTVPGGTGYLKELLENESNFMEVLSIARDALANCQCVEDKLADGCYRCVYSAEDAGNRSLISRTCALALLNGILSRSGTLRPGFLEENAGEGLGESALENDFIRAVAADSHVKRLARLAMHTSRGVFVLEMKSGRTWAMELQATMDGNDPSRPDFIFRPFHESERSLSKEMAVFTDGWRFHAGIVATDIQKRQSIIDGGRRVWTIHWDDLPHEAPTAQSGAVPMSSAEPAVVIGEPVLRTGPAATNWVRWRDAEAEKTKKTLSSFEELIKTVGDDRSSFERLMLWLSNPEAAEESFRSLGMLMRFADLFARGTPKPVPVRVPEGLGAWLESGAASQRRLFAGRGPGAERRALSLSAPWRAALMIDAAYVARHATEDAHSKLAGMLRRFWATANVLQFGDELMLLPESEDSGIENLFLTPSAMADGCPTALPPEESGEKDSAPGVCASPEITGDDDAGAWAEVRDLMLDEYIPLVAALAARGLPVPEAGIDLVDPASGRVAGVAELWWPGLKFGVALEGFDVPKGMQVLVITPEEIESGAEEAADRVARVIRDANEEENNNDRSLS